MNEAARNRFPNAHGTPLAQLERDRLLALVERVGEAAAVKVLGLSRQTFARCVAGLPVQRATAEFVARRLAEPTSGE